MNSINTNFAALTALESLNQTNKSMLETQKRISTGFRVASAEDNAAYWSMATSMRSDNKSLSAVSDALGLGAATIDVAYTAMNSSIEVVSEIKSKLVAAREPGVDRGKVQTEIDELQNQLRSIASSASFAGENWLSVDTGGTSYAATETVVSSFASTAARSRSARCRSTSAARSCSTPTRTAPAASPTAAPPRRTLSASWARPG